MISRGKRLLTAILLMLMTATCFADNSANQFTLGGMDWVQSRTSFDGPLASGNYDAVSSNQADRFDNPHLAKFFLPINDLKGQSLIEFVKSDPMMRMYFDLNNPSVFVTNTPDMILLKGSRDTNCELYAAAKGPLGVYAIMYSHSKTNSYAVNCQNWEKTVQQEAAAAAKNSDQKTLDLWLPGILKYYDTHAKEQTPAEPTDMKDVVISLEMTACFGSCPDFSLSIHGNGTVDFEGRGNVKTIGKKSVQIPTEMVKDLVHQFYANQFFSLYNNYSMPVTDLPSQVVSISVNNVKKSVSCYGSCPEAAELLMKKIYEDINSTAPGLIQ